MADKTITFDDTKWQLVPRVPTREMVQSTNEAMRPVNDALTIAFIHGCKVIWQDENPPIYHAYQAMLKAAPSPKEGE